MPVANLLGEENEGFKLILRHFQGERLVLACFANEMMQHALELALAYARERKIFGRTVASYQVWQHRLADVMTTIAASRQLTYYACDRLVRRENPESAISMAKLFATEACKPMVNECFQVFGGYAYMEEYPISPRLPGRGGHDHWCWQLGGDARNHCANQLHRLRSTFE